MLRTMRISPSTKRRWRRCVGGMRGGVDFNTCALGGAVPLWQQILAIHSVPTRLTETKRSLIVRLRFSSDREIWQGGRFACLKTWFTRPGGRPNH